MQLRAMLGLNPMQECAEIFAMTAPGLEGLLAREISQLGMKPKEIVNGGVTIEGAVNEIQKLNLHSRIANRVIVRVAEFHASTFHELERRAKKIEWQRFIAGGQPVRFRVTARKSKLYHSDAVAERLVKFSGGIAVKDIEDDDGEDGSQLFIVRVAHDTCTISADSSGELLHRRGYRQAVAKAPLRETLAAAMIAGIEWDPATPLVDPMCGAGTIPIEAAMIARNIPPGLNRSFAFEKWPDHDAAKWNSMRDQARETVLPKAPAPIIASDRDAGAVEAATANAKRAGVLGDIDISRRAVSDAEYPQPAGVILTNPPYGMRVGESGPLRNLYSQLGRIVREAAPGYRIGLLSADKALEGQLRLDLNEVFRTTNGGIPVRLVAG
jgi:putative N6-adenine-specific DNA methylase